MIKLDRIVVSNYKNIEEADLPLGNINLVVGENNAGKTNFLESISLLNFIINGPSTEVEKGMDLGGLFESYGIIHTNYFKTNQDELSISLTYSESDQSLKFDYNIRLGAATKGNNIKLFPPIGIVGESLTYKEKRNTGKAITLFTRDLQGIKGDSFKKAEISVLPSHISAIRFLSLLLSSDKTNEEHKTAIQGLNEILLTPTFYFSNYLLKSRDTKYENTTRIARFDLDEAIHKIGEGEHRQSFLNAIKQTLNFDDFATVKTSAMESTIHVMFNLSKTKKFIHELSDGSVIMLAFITKLFSDSSNIFFIEEPENSIHPKALGELMKLIFRHSLDKQFIITTHSPYLLNMIKPEDVFVASIGEAGMSKIEKLSNVKEIKRKLSKGFMNFGDIVFSQPDADEDEE